jgi:hypothetical protein
MNQITSFLIYTQYGLVNIVHSLEELQQIEKINWIKVEIWKFGTRQNVIEKWNGYDKLMEYAIFYFKLIQPNK